MSNKKRFNYFFLFWDYQKHNKYAFPPISLNIHQNDRGRKRYHLQPPELPGFFPLIQQPPRGFSRFLTLTTHPIGTATTTWVAPLCTSMIWGAKEVTSSLGCRQSLCNDKRHPLMIPINDDRFPIQNRWCAPWQCLTNMSPKIFFSKIRDH